MITPDQAGTLASLLARIRPNDWKPKQLMALFEKHHADYEFPALAEAAIRAANNPAIRSPEAIFLPGKHWTQPDKLPDHGPPRELQCPEHNTTEGRCRRKHYRTEPPKGWRTIGDPGATLPHPDQQYPPEEPTGGGLSAANEPPGTSTHNPPAKPSSTAKNQNGATP